MSKLKNYLEVVKNPKNSEKKFGKDYHKAQDIMGEIIFTSVDWETGNLTERIFQAMEAYADYKLNEWKGKHVKPKDIGDLSGDE